MVSWEEQERQERQDTARHLAVLDALTDRVSRSTITQGVDTRHLPDSAGYSYKRNADDVDREKYKDGSLTIEADDEDDDWRDIRACGHDSDLPADPFVHFYDSETGIMYYVEHKYNGNAYSETGPTQDVLPSVDASATDAHVTTSYEPETDEILSRLEVMNGQYGPHGYSAWLSQQLQDRDRFESDIPGFASLCGACNTMLTHSLCIFKRLFNEKPGEAGLVYDTHHQSEIFRHYGTLKAVRASAHAGCHLCSLLLGPLVHTKDRDDSTTYFLGLKFDVLRLSSSDHTTVTKSWIVWSEGNTEAVSTLKHSTTGALEVGDLAHSWLTRCLEEDRGLCSIATTFLPSRLIQIVTESGSLRSARLVLGSDLPSETQYLTLSHCWGNGEAKPLSLTKETLDSFRNNIPLSILSKTFRETLLVTARLGYRHVWIDSLCILQDSDKDWEHEAARMGDIYRHSTCTIAAKGARDGNDGLFFERHPLTHLTCPLFTGKGIQMFAKNLNSWAAPLYDRAWAVQEQYLSPRTLSFGSDKISWACRRTETCEGPHAHDIQMWDPAFSELLDRNTDERTAGTAWDIIVVEYSASKLTYWKDKWPAFQGLTAEVEKAQGWILVHGLRRHLLSRDLLWHMIGEATDRKAIDCGEPSWSWLNVKDGVGLYLGEWCSDAKIILQEPSAPADARIASHNLSEHVLQVEACMTSLKAAPRCGEYGGWECTLTVKNPKYKTDRFEEPVLETDRQMNGYWDPDTLSSHHGDLQALQICAEWSWEEDVKEWLHKTRGLVITAVLDRPGYWRRVGFYRTNKWHDPLGQALNSKDSEGRAYES